MTPSRDRFVFAIFVFVVSAVGARADVGPGFFTDEYFPDMRFDNLADYPEFDFYLQYYHGKGNPSSSPYIMRVHPGKAISRFEGSGRIGGVHLIAVPHGRKLSTGRENLSAKLPDDCLSSNGLEGIDLGPGHLVLYEVKIEDNKLRVSQRSQERLIGATVGFWIARLPCIALPVAFCAFLGWLGARIARRLTATKSFPPAT